MRKGIAVGLALVLSLGLAACGGSGSNSSSARADSSNDAAAETSSSAPGEAAPASSVAEETEAPAEETPGETIEIEFWLAQGNKVMELVNAEIDAFNNTQNRYHVTAVQQENQVEAVSNLQAAIESHSAPDVAVVAAAPARQFYEEGVLVPISNYSAADSEFHIDDFYPDLIANGLDGDTLFALPWYSKFQIAYYNIKAFEDAGIDPASVKSWQDLAAHADAFKEAGYERVWEPMGGDAKSLIDVAFTNGAKILSDDGRTVTLNSPEWVEVWEAFRGWIHDDGIMEAKWNGLEEWAYWYDTIADVTEGRAAGYTGSPPDSVDFDFNIIRPMEQFGWNDAESRPWAQTMLLVMPDGNGEEKQQGAYAFIKYLTNPENQAAYTIRTKNPAANRKVAEVPEYQAFLEKNPVAGVLLEQAAHVSSYPEDPTGGAILDALNAAARALEEDGRPAQEVLDEAAAAAQVALDEALS